MKEENIESMMELSPLQQGMLFHTLYAPGSGVYVVHWSVLLEGGIEVSLFQRAWQHVIDRHAALRTSFHWEELEKPVQVVYRQIPLTLDHRSWRRLSPAEQQERLAEYLRADRERGFDPEVAPLMRLALFELGEDRWQFVWSFHHLYLDGWSNNLVLSELFHCYEAFSEGQPVRLAPPRPYEHYVAWLGEQDLGLAKRYWQTLLAGFTAPVPLARWQDPSPDEHDDYRELELTVSTETSSAVRALAQQHRLTLNTLVQGAWGLLLSRYTGANDVVFGNTTSGRPADLPGVESMVGLFINTLPVRVKVEPQELALPWLERFQDLLADLRQYEYTPLDRVRGWSEIAAGTALFDNILVFENYPWNVARERDSQALRVSGLRTVERTNYPMTVAVIPGPQLTVKLLYDRRYFDAAAVRRMGRHYEHLLHGLAADPAHRRLGEVPMLAAAERRQLLLEWNDVARSFPRDATLHALFEAQAER
ncbi:MAG: non-ribosomal peptide synthetase, partial [bacterium]|nr:non-ribosomal peptide synthetase [bacterium]